MPLKHHAEKYLRNAKIAGSVHPLAVQFPSVQNEVTLERPQDLGDGCIGVPVLEDVFPLRENAVKERFLIKDLRGTGVLGLARTGIEFIQRIDHPAVLDAEDGIARVRIPCERTPRRPIPERGGRVERGRISGRIIGINEPRKQLVQRIPRHPRLRCDVRSAPLHVVKLRFDPRPLRQRRPPDEAAMPCTAL